MLLPLLLAATPALASEADLLRVTDQVHRAIHQVADGRTTDRALRGWELPLDESAPFEQALQAREPHGQPLPYMVMLLYRAFEGDEVVASVMMVTVVDDGLTVAMGELGPPDLTEEVNWFSPVPAIKRRTDRARAGAEALGQRLLGPACADLPTADMSWMSPYLGPSLVGPPPTTSDDIAAMCASFAGFDALQPVGVGVIAIVGQPGEPYPIPAGMLWLWDGDRLGATLMHEP